jgi:hypothetical protein
MLDFKGLFYNKHELRILSLNPVNQRKVNKIYGSQNNMLVYTAFLLETISPNFKPAKTSHEEVLEKILEKVKSVREEKVTKEVYTDSVQLYDSYNNSIRIMMRFKREYGWQFPFTNFSAHSDYLDVLKFVCDFRKENYPLVGGWDEFVMALPNYLSRKGQLQAAINFYGLLNFVKKGEFDYWYRLSKGYGKKGENINWVDAYNDELRGYSDKRLNEEIGLGGWGMVHLLKERMRRMEKHEEV